MDKSRLSTILVVFAVSIVSLQAHAESTDVVRAGGGPLTTVAFGSCADQNKPQPVWEAIVAKSPDLFLFLGDNVYADSVDSEKIREAYIKLGRQPGYKQLRQTCPILATWDDHDYGINDGGSEHPNKKAAQRAFLDFFGVPSASKLREREGVYQSMVFGPEGKRTQVIMLDTRYHRGKLAGITIAGRTIYAPRDDPQVTMLGEQQWKWLAQQLNTPAELRLVVSSIQVLPTNHPFEKWQNLPRQRERLLSMLRQISAGAVLILSGDQHLGEITKLRFQGFDFWESTSSGLTHHRGDIPAPNSHRVGEPLIANNFGLLEIDWEQGDPRITMTICDVNGEARTQQNLRFSELSPVAL